MSCRRSAESHRNFLSPCKQKYISEQNFKIKHPEENPKKQIVPPLLKRQDEFATNSSARKLTLNDALYMLDLYREQLRTHILNKRSHQANRMSMF